MSSLRETSTLSDGTRYTEDDQYVKSAYPWHAPRTPAVTTAEYSTAPTYQYNVPPAQSATFADGSSHADDIKLSMRDEYGDITGLNARLGKNVPKIEALHQQNAQMKGQIMTLERQIAELREALANSVPREQYTRAQEELNALRRRIGQLEAELSQLRAEKAALERECSRIPDLERQIQELLARLRAMESADEGYRSALEESRRRVAQLEGQVADLASVPPPPPPPPPQIVVQEVERVVYKEIEVPVFQPPVEQQKEEIVTSMTTIIDRETAARGEANARNATLLESMETVRRAIRRNSAQLGAIRRNSLTPHLRPPARDRELDAQVEQCVARGEDLRDAP